MCSAWPLISHEYPHSNHSYSKEVQLEKWEYFGVLYAHLNQKVFAAMAVSGIAFDREKIVCSAWSTA